MELDEIKKEYYKVLKELSKGSHKTIEELDAEISKALKDCQNVDEIMIRASELFDE